MPLVYPLRASKGHWHMRQEFNHFEHFHYKCAQKSVNFATFTNALCAIGICSYIEKFVSNLSNCRPTPEHFWIRNHPPACVATSK